MKKHIWISGTMNSGKSTVAKLLSKRLSYAIIELDRFSENVCEFMDFPAYIDLNYAMISEIVALYEKNNILCIIVYPINNKRYQELPSMFVSLCTFFSIDPSIEVALSSRGKDRILDSFARDRIEYHYGEGKLYEVDFAERIFTKDMTPEQTSDVIFLKMQSTV